ncbi:MAG: glycosyltransferase family 4 protein [candidate division Zixibacteria bacterium]|nr:glycosyltransferase family 4 protein [candidate division Zixibacteria bacterium]
MNLLFLDSIDRATFGGYENWILLVAEYFAARNHGVTLAGRPDSEYLRRGRNLPGSIDLLELDISGDFNPATISRIRRELSERRIDIMTVNFNKDVRLGGLAARWQGDTRVVWRVGLDITSAGWAHRVLTPKLVDGVVVPSESLKRQVMRHGYLSDDMVTVIYNGTADKTFVRPNPEAARELRHKYHLAADSVVAVSVGRFVDQKGHVYLVEAAPEIVRSHPEIRFLWLGDGPHETMLRERIAELGLGDYFVFAGMLDTIDLELAGADLMIHPAVEEPFSHAILECMRAGLPIAASRVGGIPEAVVDNESALLVPAKQPRALALAVVSLLDRPNVMASFGEANQKRWYQHFRLDTMMTRFEDYFTAMLARAH